MRKLITIFYALSAIIFMGCSTKYYTPNTLNVPMLKDEGQLHLNSSLSLGDQIDGIEVQAAYSITNHIGVMANYFVGREAFSSVINRSGKGNLGEGGIGLFTEIEDNTVLEVYTGMGLGNINRTYDNSSSSSIHLARYFVQPSLGYTSDYFAVSLSMRLNYMHWYRVNYITPNAIYRPYEDELQQRNYFQAEPALTVRAGLRNIKLQAQVIASGSDPNLKQEQVMAYLGLIVSFNNVLPKSMNNKSL